ncbi:hybrid sensor histidine kinase/response regulator [Pseudorhodobacter ferrugineus]|uniref:hybrid sensor histidine kinase/response regulator n=1 Tax=Pseudorhodobacter ferrugineus TaxID=77008 RepID=UPI0003B341B7|nr:response regulator [Pseudorhodobacter ferrugineus]
MNENLRLGLPNSARPHTTPQTSSMTEELALLGHDIRSAVTDVLAGLAMVDDQNLTESDRQQLARVRVSAASLVRYLEDGLTTLLADAPPELDQAPTHIAELVQDLTHRFCYSTGQNQNAVITASADLPATIICNRTALDRILTNLISNAITHSDGQTVRLVIARPASDQICFSVIDQGPGFPDHLGDRMQNSRAIPAWQTSEGHGLGLRIAHILAQRMGATLDLRNQDGGAVAALTLPLLPDAQATPTPPVQSQCLTGKRVLIADDSAPQLLLLDKFLRDCGAETTIMRDGITAERALLAGHFDLALIDHEMPGRTGLQICTALRDTPLRIVLLTAHHLPAVHHAALAAGAAQVLVKPITSAQSLAAALCDVLGQSLPNAPPPRDPTGFDRLLDMAGPDLAAELLASYQNDLTAVQTKMQMALHPLDWPALCAASHVLIALAGTAGDTALEHSARAFNTAANAQDTNAVSQQKEAVLDGLAGLLTLLHQIEQERHRI